MTLAFQFLNIDGSCFHGGEGNWPLPDRNGPGDWLDKKGEIVATQSGLHLCRRKDLCLWVGPALFVTEIKGIIEEEKGSIVVSSARIIAQIESWNEGAIKRFGTKCYEHIVSGYKLKEEPARNIYFDRLKSAYAAKNFIWLPRIARSLANEIDNEIDWQNRELWEYIQEEILNQFNEGEFV